MFCQSLLHNSGSTHSHLKPFIHTHTEAETDKSSFGAIVLQFEGKTNQKKLNSFERIDYVNQLGILHKIRWFLYIFKN